MRLFMCTVMVSGLLVGKIVLAGTAVGSEAQIDKEFTLAQSFVGSTKLKEGRGELYATIHTNLGDMVVHLFEKEVPNTVANFVGLARGTRDWQDPKSKKWFKKPLYKNVLCHRVIPNFMIQCGDPEGSGSGGPGYTFADEFKPNLRHDRPGILSMANRGPNTNGSQFFITEVPTPHLNDRHTIFGEVVKNIELVSQIARVQTGAMNRPVNDVVIKSIDIFRSEKAPKP